MSADALIIPPKPSLSRRGLLRGLIAAPAIITIDRLMPLKVFTPRAIVYTFDDWMERQWQILAKKLAADVATDLLRNDYSMSITPHLMTLEQHAHV